MGAQALKVLVTGRGKSGSWVIRAEQLGRAIGADVIPNALDVAAYDMAIVVKRPRLDIVERARRASVPVVWDIVDAWPQPEGNRWDRATCLSWLRGHIEQIRPQGIVAATRAMAADCEEIAASMKHRASVLYLPHHHRPGIERNPIRERVRTVGYEGGPQYLGKWRDVMQSECKRRGWLWVENPISLSTLDIVVALREADGYAPRHYKSGVKLSNAQGSGTPFIGSPEAGYREMAIGVECFVKDEAELRRALDKLTPLAERTRCSGWMHSVAPKIDSVAAQYRKWLETLRA